MNLIQITQDVRNALMQTLLKDFPYLAQNADGQSFLYKARPELHHNGYWLGEMYSDKPILTEAYCYDWEQSLLKFNSTKKLVSVGKGEFFVPITDRKSDKFKEAYTTTQLELCGLFTVAE